MGLQQKSRLAAAALALCFAAGRASAASEFIQDQSQFRAAIENGSTSVSFVLITIVDARSGARETRCVLAPFLLNAIAKENGISLRGNEAPVKNEALARADHVFTFKTPEALASFGTNNPRYEQACAIIRAGQSAYMQDRSGQIRTGQP